MSEETSEPKKHPASRRKLRRLRREGQVAKSRDLAAMLSAMAGGAALLLSIPMSLTALLNLFDTTFDQIDEPFSIAAPILSMSLQSNLLRVVVPVAGAAVVVGLVTSLAFNGGPVMSIKPLVPNMQRLSPLKRLGEIFGRRGLIEFAMSALRLSLWGVLAWLILGAIVEEVLFAGVCGAACMYQILTMVLVPVLVSAAVLFLIFAMLDGYLQKELFLFEQRMTDTEQKRERKEQLGSPEVKREQQRLRKKLAGNAEHIGIDKATMLVFFEDRAVAIRYDPENCPAPRLAAKGVGDAAVTRMRTYFAERGLRDWTSDNLVSALIKTEVGDPIDTKHYPLLVQGMVAMYG